MKKIIYSIFLQFIIFSFCHSAGSPSILADTTAKAPDYKAVNVVIETEWSGPEKINNVDVFVESDNNKPAKLLLIGENNRCEIRIISGMVAKIIDSNTGKLITQIKGPEEPKKK